MFALWRGTFLTLDWSGRHCDPRSLVLNLALTEVRRPCLLRLPFFAVTVDVCLWGRVLAVWGAFVAGPRHGTDGDPTVPSSGHCSCSRPALCPAVYLSVRPCCSKDCPHDLCCLAGCAHTVFAADLPDTPLLREFVLDTGPGICLCTLPQKQLTLR